jgi:hypothetical protein
MAEISNPCEERRLGCGKNSCVDFLVDNEEENEGRKGEDEATLAEL